MNPSVDQHLKIQHGCCPSTCVKLLTNVIAVETCKSCINAVKDSTFSPPPRQNKVSKVEVGYIDTWNDFFHCCSCRPEILVLVLLVASGRLMASWQPGGRRSQWPTSWPKGQVWRCTSGVSRWVDATRSGVWKPAEWDELHEDFTKVYIVPNGAESGSEQFLPKVAFSTHTPQTKQRDAWVLDFCTRRWVKHGVVHSWAWGFISSTPSRHHSFAVSRDCEWWGITSIVYGPIYYGCLW